MVQLFKSPADRAEDEFQKAYEKGISLGRPFWPTAVSHFQEAAVQFQAAGQTQKANQSKALALFFTALNSKNADQWNKVSASMADCSGADLNIGFVANSDSIANESLVYSKELSVMSQFDPASGSQSQAVAMRELAQNYLDLVGSNLDIWKLMGQTIDPQRRAYYLLGLASLSEANSIVGSDPKRSASLLSEAVALARSSWRRLPERATSDSTREGQRNKNRQMLVLRKRGAGLTFHYVALKADISAYTKALYGSGMPPSIEGGNVLSCTACYSAFKNVSDQIALMYYEKTMQEVTTLSRRVSDIETRLSRLESRNR